MPSHQQIPGFDRVSFAHAGREHDVFRAGTGPAVVVIHELPGLHPGVVTFGRVLADAGYGVYLPSLFGRPGEPLTAAATLRSVARVCLAREFRILADRTSPVASWLRALAARAYEERGGRGVGAVGMCFTGGFALAMAVEPSMLAAVLSQPALPAPIGRRGRAGLGLDPDDLARVKQRAAHELGVLGLRFTGDRGCPAERFQRLRNELGDSLRASRSTLPPPIPTASPRAPTPSSRSISSTSPATPPAPRATVSSRFLNERLH